MLNNHCMLNYHIMLNYPSMLNFHSMDIKKCSKSTAVEIEHAVLKESTPLYTLKEPSPSSDDIFGGDERK